MEFTSRKPEPNHWLCLKWITRNKRCGAESVQRGECEHRVCQQFGISRQKIFESLSTFAESRETRPMHFGKPEVNGIRQGKNQIDREPESVGVAEGR